MISTIRSLLVLLAGIVAIMFVANRFVNAPDFKLPKDFLEYWAAGRLAAQGDNPYDAVQLLAEQRTADPGRADAVMMWNPPWTLPLYLPLGVLPARWASLVWVGLQLVAVMLACDLLWRIYHPTGLRWVGQVVGVSFVGTSWLMAYGQNTGLLLLGLAGFLHFTRNDRPIAAGVCAALTALKPHLLAGFGVLLLADCVTRRGRTTIAAGVGVIALSLGLAHLTTPGVAQQFLAAVRDPGPGAVPLHGWTLPVPSYWLRMAVNPQWFWVQFVPCAVAWIALVAWRFRAGDRWDWPRAMPWVVAVSVLTTPYGGWIFDLPVLLVPVLAVAARLVAGQQWALFVVFLVGQLTVNVVAFATPGALHAYWWVTSAVLGLCLLGIVAPVRRMPVTTFVEDRAWSMERQSTESSSSAGGSAGCSPPGG